MGNNSLKLDNLKLLREKKNITQLKLSMDIDVSQELISQYELGKSLPTINNLLKLADYFNCSTDYLLGRTATDLPVNALIMNKQNIEYANIINKYDSLIEEDKKYFSKFLDFLSTDMKEDK